MVVQPGSLQTTNIHADQHAAATLLTGQRCHRERWRRLQHIRYHDWNIDSLDGTEQQPQHTQFYGYFGLHPTDSQVTYGGTQDNGTQKYSGN